MKTEKHWEKIGLYPHHGVALPLSSLRTQKSCGIGEFFDLMLLIDWCKKIDFDCIQLWPLNDTGSDTSPYNALSSCALDPIYLSLHALEDVNAKELIESFHSLTHLPRVAIQEVKQKKIKWLYTYFQKHFSKIRKTKKYSEFVEKHSWLLPYALFKTLKHLHNDQSWQDWPLDAREYHPKLVDGHQESIDFYTFLQYLSYSQLEEVKRYATSQNIFLKGDIPILLSPDSADVWSRPSLFDLTLSAGAPPDYYNKHGQKWGFPLINWEAMEKEDFAWWKERLQVSGLFFHLYRIDHVVGFFRIWGIPLGKKAKEGHFIPKDPHLWPLHGKKILEMLLKTSPLLPIAEDLGTIPKEVPILLKNLGICGTKVVRWQRDWEGDRSYLSYASYEPFSMTTVSTHDCDTLSGWWQNFPEEAQSFAFFKGWTYEKTLSLEQLFEILKDAHQTPSYFHINLLQEYLALFPELVHHSPEQERINIPGSQTPQNWTYRFKPFLEEIVLHEKLGKAMRTFVSER